MQNLNRRQFTASLLGGAAFAGTKKHELGSSTTNQGLIAARWEAVSPGIWKCRIGEPEPHTPVKSRLIAAKHISSIADAVARPSLLIEGKTTSRGVFVKLPLQPRELMYGFGLQLQSFQQRSKKRTIRVNADPKGDSGDSHAPVPFYVTTGGYGIFVDTFRNVTFACGNSPLAPSGLGEEAGPRNDSPSVMRQQDRQLAGEVRIEVPRAQGVDVYLFAGPSMLQAVQRYNMFSGGGVNPPTWGLGFWYRPELHLTASEVVGLMKEFRASEMPCDVIGLEPGWQSHAYSCSFMWDKKSFPDPQSFIHEANEAGFRINLWEHAYTHPSSPIFQKLRPYAGDYGVFRGLVPDFADERARNIFGGHHASHFVDAGVSGFKLDECDNSDFTSGWSWPDFASYPSGLDGEQMHAAFGIRYQHTMLEAFRSRNKETYGLVRSSGALAAPYPFVLYSDLYDHREFIRALVNSGFSGLMWCPEVRDASSEEDLIRRLQSVVFSPVAMVNAWYIKNPPWKQIDRDKNNAAVFAAGWEKLEARCREIVGWRMSLIPYLRQAFTLYAETGLPPFRPLILDFPEDDTLANVDDQYLIGDRLMVAPLFAGEVKRTVRFPRGRWHDFWTGEVHSGELNVDASFSRIPLFVRENSVIPWAEVAPHTDDPRARLMRMRIYGDGSLLWQGMKPAHSEWRSAKSEKYTITSWDHVVHKGVRS